MKNNYTQYYVYVYLDPTLPGIFKYGNFSFNYKPFYIGKGKNRRMYNHLQPKYLSKKCLKSEYINSLLDKNKLPIIEKIKDNLSSRNAYEFETEMLKLIGQINKGTGPLTNNMCKGRGLDSHSQETKDIIGKYSRNRRHTLETKRKLSFYKKGKNNPMYKNGKYAGIIKTGLSRSEAKLGVRNPMYGKKLTKDQKYERSINSTRRKTYEIIYSDGKIEVFHGLLEYCRKHNIESKMLRRVITGERKHYKGMKIREI